MCGIVGYIGEKKAHEVIINGLKRLEYRGYDSAGIALFNGSLEIKKGKGKVAKLESLVDSSDESKIGIGHTRWATHGEPNDINSHPHTSSSEKLALVHNGIIENYNSLKKVLESKGHTFYSQTDTEVLAKLIEDVYSKNPDDFKKAVQIALAQVEGTYGVAIIHADFPDQLIVAMKGSPFLIGVGDGEMLNAYNASALAK